MSKKNIDRSVESRVCFEQLEEWVREQIQFYVQELLEDEVTQLLGSDVNEKVSKEMAGGQAKGLQDLQDVDSFPKCEVSLNLFNSHLTALTSPQQKQTGDQDVQDRKRQHDRPSQSHQMIPPETGQGPANQHHEKTEDTHLE